MIQLFNMPARPSAQYLLPLVLSLLISACGGGSGSASSGSASIYGANEGDAGGFFDTPAPSTDMRTSAVPMSFPAGVNFSFLSQT